MKKISGFKKGAFLTICLLLSVHLVALAQNVRVTGSVMDKNGDPLPGVSIVVKGTTSGTITAGNGAYELEAPSATSTLVYSFIGFESQEIVVGNQSVINVNLADENLGLDEVVVVGYGVQRKSDITGSITSVDMSKLKDVATSNVTKALQGKTAGLEVQNMSTRPGGDTRIRIRGNRSLTASNDPLIVVDGIPYGGSLNDINSDDIGSIEILKDASATVIYGSRGANGVIIITTKRGKAGDVKITYNGYMGVNNVARQYDVFDAEEFTKLRTVSGWNDYLAVETESMLLGRETNWQDLIYQTGKISSHEVSMSGGSEKTQYSVSGAYFNETGVLPEMGYQRYNMRFAVDQEIGKYLKVGLTSMNSYALTDGQSASPMWALVSLSPLAIPYNADGSVVEQPVYPSYNTYNPLTLKDTNRWKEQNRRMATFNSIYGEVNLAKGLKYRVNVGIDFYDNKYNNYFGSNTQFKEGGLNTAQVQNSDNLSWTVENLVTYEKTFAEKHRLSFTGMYSAQESEFTSSRFNLTNVAADYLQYNNPSLAETVEAPSNNNNTSTWGLVSYMGRINYAFADKYLVTLTGRADGSSRLSPGNKWHSYPAVALGWNIVNEPFMENIPAITNLKLRVGYGQTSNTAVNPYSTLGGLSRSLYNFGEDGVKGQYVTTLPNKALGWEFTTSTNIGVDFAVLDGRISGSVDAFLQQTDDLLLGKSLPPNLGVSGSYLENVGKTENRGLEIVLNGTIFRPKTEDGFGWDVSANMFMYREKIVALQDPSIKKDIGNGWFVGEPSSSIYDYVKQGIWQLGEETEATVYNCKPGDIKLLDFAGGGENGNEPDGKITDADRRIIGSSQPDFQGGFTSTWNYKGFDFSVVGYFRSGGLIVSTVHMPNAYFNRLDGRRNNLKVDYWSETNPTNDMPKPNASIDASKSSVLGYFDGSFLKIRSINLGYNLPKSLTHYIGDNSTVRVYTSVTDPFIFFSPYIDKGGVDPEPTGTREQDGNSSSLGAVPAKALVVSLSTPPTTKFIFGLNIKF